MIKPLRFFSAQSIANIKNNSELFWSKMKENPSSLDWMSEVLLEKEPMLKSPYSFDFEFLYSDLETKENLDLDNNIRFYEAVKDLPKNIILSEQFLSGFLFTYGYEYFMNRWAPTYKDYGQGVLSHIFFYTNSRRSITINALGHFLQLAFQLVDESLCEHKYDLLKRAYKYSGLFMLSYYTYADNPKIYQAFALLAIEMGDQGLNITTKEYRLLAKHLSMIQSVSMGEILEADELKLLLKEYLLMLRS